MELKKALTEDGKLYLIKQEPRCIIYNADCLEQMKLIPDKSVNMVLCDLPYGTTTCKWDSIIPFKPLWEQYERIIKDNGAIVLFSQQPFTSALVSSNYKIFRYEWIYEKSHATGFLNSKKMPLKKHENIMVFYKKAPIYNPQFTEGKPYKTRGGGTPSVYRQDLVRIDAVNDGKRYPIDILRYNSNNFNRLHPTQKPVDLLEYLIKTYTNEGDIVLDNCMGSGSTGVACINTNRKFIGIEKDGKYFNTSWERLQETLDK